jgi:hypothetical protein
MVVSTIAVVAIYDLGEKLIGQLRFDDVGVGSYEELFM